MKNVHTKAFDIFIIAFIYWAVLMPRKLKLNLPHCGINKLMNVNDALRKMQTMFGLCIPCRG
ncbi:hypothetical protein A4A50_06980 [Haemophilus influenzae]|nr:hypothetical protein A4A50_06980 [Haemophilus influenzae]